jgi:catechol 2,3-dioxygenase-like lactoylglutathione lyase family enzyme
VLKPRAVGRGWRDDGAMTGRINNITFDCADAHALAGFWAEVLGWNVYFDDDPEVMVAPAFPPPRGNVAPTMLFIPVPEGKTAKNRMHVDIAPTDRTRDDEVQRLVALGATFVADHRTDEGAGWVVLADPEGNELCIERSDAERGVAKPQRHRITSD